MVRVDLLGLIPHKESMSTRSSRWFDTVGFVIDSPLYNTHSVKRVTQIHRDHTYAFALKKHSPELLDFLENSFVRGIATVAVLLHPYERKANKDPYFKHLLATASILWKPVIKPLIDRGHREEALITIAVALLHDCIEIQRKYHKTLSSDQLRELLLVVPQANETRIRRIIDIVIPFTPKVEGEVVPLTPEGNMHWVMVKLYEFRTKMREGSGKDTWIFHTVKAADMIVNIRETFEDLKAGRDADMKRPLALRLLVFEHRIKEFLQMTRYNPLSPLLQETLVSVRALRKKAPGMIPLYLLGVPYFEIC